MATTTGPVRGTRGQALLFITMSLTAMLGLMGMVFDVGWGYWRKEAAQTAAASAASAAIAAASSGTACGSGWDCTSSYSCAASPSLPVSNNLDNGCLYAKQNGFLNTGRQTVTLKSGSGAPPTTSGVSAAYYVVATVTESIPTLFSAALGQPWMQVKGQATGILLQGGGGGCVFVLDGTASGSWTQSGGTFTTGCGIYIDSNSASALTMSGGNIGLSGGSSLYIVGNKSQTGGNITFAGGGSLKTGQSAHGDPMSGLVAPTPATTCTPDPSLSGTSNYTIPSGTYCGLSISGGTGLVLSGTYIIKTGNFAVSGGNVTSAAGGATIYFPPSNTSGTISNSGGNTTLNGSTSGSLQGIAIWKDSTTLNNASISGGNLTIGGIIYMPKTVLAYSGGNTPVQLTIIVDEIQMSGGNISQPYSSPYFSSGASPSGNFLVQ
jgi:hypothetical protein